MQIWAEPEKAALPICNYSQILYQFLTFTQNLKRSHKRESDENQIPFWVVFLELLFCQQHHDIVATLDEFCHSIYG